ncbi:hypothetical protein ASC95_18085 [Pelomonas sp. Root1217]|uniref:hypothetical protein n=1 Tax=Pelomonas sp. Root1217 TaxID=1736430 RepID=UPI00070E2ABF|nr:hypothetical protein [Pelomonas sp. Root1217]KQV49503.1 hypothetical protein ASC95_18085 [Pelomonas sp. Root1217]
MQILPSLGRLQKPLLALSILYFAASLGHFAHNAEFICEYPKLPQWLTSAKVYGAWLAITSVGALGYVLLKKSFLSLGLAVLAVYAAIGFDGLGHYAVAPMQFHTLGANITILSEVAAAALLLSATLLALTLHLSGVRKDQRASDLPANCSS